MNIWFLLWVFLAIFMFGLFGWSFHILLRQKRAWGQFAKKHNLTVTQGRLFSSSSVAGYFKAFPLYIYSEEQAINQTGTRRFRTIIQMDLPAPMAAPGVIASADGANFVNSLGLKDTVVPEVSSWNKSILFKTDHPEQLKFYITEERAKSLNALMSIKTIACILIFDEKNTYLRFETPDAFDNADKLERFINKAAEHAKVLSI